MASNSDVDLILNTRSRVAHGAEVRVVHRGVVWSARRTAIIVCDMWDTHWCKSAAARVGQLAPTMDRVIAAARSRGVFVIHAPSDTMPFYADTIQRRRAIEAQAAQPADTPCERVAPPLPVDDSDGGCDDDPPCVPGRPWARQHPAIRIAPDDAVTDNGQEAGNLLHGRSIDHVIVMGVHTNMCVLARPFGIRRLVSRGVDTVLMRDMTDSMVNPRINPGMDHFGGTEMVVQYIETHWCPTVLSADFTGEAPFRFPDDRRTP